LSSKKRYDFYEAHVGRTMRVLFENPRQGFWPSYTDNYIRVVVASGDANGMDLANRCAEVKLDKISADFVEGSLVRMLD